jgi:hypothetical protein
VGNAKKPGRDLAAPIIALDASDSLIERFLSEFFGEVSIARS